MCLLCSHDAPVANSLGTSAYNVEPTVYFTRLQAPSEQELGLISLFFFLISLFMIGVQFIQHMLINELINPIEVDLK